MRRKQITLTDRLPAYFLYDYATLGNFSLTTRDERFILDEYAVTIDGETDTPGHHFSKILEAVSFPKKTGYSDTVSYPYYAKPCLYPYGFYVDIRKAFYQIANIYGLETSHSEGRYMAFGNTKPPEIFASSKIMRALLVSGTHKTSTLQEWKNGQLTSRQFPNRNYAPMLQRAILSTLHAISYSLRKWILYCHTDGFITGYRNIDRVTKYLEQRGVEYSIKAEGIVQIYGVGSYRIGNTRTVTNHNQKQEHTNITGINADWWLKQWDRGRSRVRDL